MSSENQLSKEKELSQILCLSKKESHEKKQEIQVLKRDILDLRQKVTDFNDEVRAKNKIIDHQKGQLNKYEISMKEQIKKITSLEKERSDTLADFQKKMSDKESINLLQKTRINEMIESGKKYESTIKLLTSEKNNLMNKKQKKEIQNLRQQRKYFEEHNNHHKQKVVAVSHTAVKQKEVYANAMRKVAVDNVKTAEQVFEEMYQKFVDYFKDSRETSKRKMIGNLAKSITDVNEKMDTIHEKQRKMEKHSVDGRKSCGSCEKTFANIGDLKHHLTVKHKINTTDINENEIQIIQID